MKTLACATTARRATVVFSAMLVLSAATVSARDAAPIQVSFCGTVVPAGRNALLVQDLDCPGYVAAISLDAGASLDLDGHHISGAQNTISFRPLGPDGLTIARQSRWVLRGPGAVSGSRYGGPGTTNGPGCVRVWGNGVLAVSDVDLSDCEWLGILAQTAEVHAEHVTIHDVPGVDISAPRIRARDVAIERTESIGLAATGTVRARRVTVHGASVGISAASLRGDDVVVSDSSSHGVDVSGSVFAFRLVATGNGGFGVRAAGPMTLIASSVTDNGDAGSPTDLGSFVRPRLLGSVCERSVDLGHPSDDLGVCSGDAR